MPPAAPRPERSANPYETSKGKGKKGKGSRGGPMTSKAVIAALPRVIPFASITSGAIVSALSASPTIIPCRTATSGMPWND